MAGLRRTAGLLHRTLRLASLSGTLPRACGEGCYDGSLYRSFNSPQTSSFRVVPANWKIQEEKTAPSTREVPISKELMLILEQRMLAMEARHSHIAQALSKLDPSTEDYIKLNKEFSKLDETVQRVVALRAKRKEVSDLKALANDAKEDKEIRQVASDELISAISVEVELHDEILFRMLPRDEADSRNCILEVRAGTGGSEASLFAMDIFKMYERFALKNSWDFEVLDVTQSDLSGYKEASASISGENIYGKLKFESGVHRVQRVPVTEKGSRVHTSTASVAILPQADEVDVDLRNEELRIDTYRSGGSGGQHANTTNSAVRVTHIPTGIVVTIQDERSQHRNKSKALQLLRAKLYDRERLRQMASRSDLRMNQIGSGDRSERIRTYNFPQGRVTDHRVAITQHNIEQVLQGEGLDVFIEALQLRQEVEAIASLQHL